MNHDKLLLTAGQPKGRIRFLFLAILAVACLTLLAKGVIPSLGTSGGDFANYYTASRLLIEGESVRPAYDDFSWFQKQIDRFGISHQVGGWIPHPPPTAFVFLPLTVFSPHAAKELWILLNVCLVFLNIFLLVRISRLHWLPVSALFFGVGYGLLNNFLFGQLYLLVLAALLLSIWLCFQGKHTAAGLVMGCLAPVKYISIPFLLFFAWRKEWRLVVAAISVIAAVITTAYWLDSEALRYFVTDVLPRHLKGEIQDPYAVGFQSWSSLFRRLFLYEATLNPHPVIISPVLYFISKNIAHWTILGLSALMILDVRFPDRTHRLLFQLGIIPMAVLLVSPGTATYHFLLLTMSAVFFVRILIDQGRVNQAVLLGMLWIGMNLPHYMKIKEWASAWMVPLGFTRLWLLLIFFLAVMLLFKAHLRWSSRTKGVCFGSVALIVVLTTVIELHVHYNRAQDAARPLRVEGSEFQRHLSLIVQDPDLGRQDMVFSYCQLLDERYGIFALDGEPWLSDASSNFFNPDLAADDRSLLVETIRNGRHEIWLSRDPGKAVFLKEGKAPSWHPSGSRFVYEGKGQLCIGNLESSAEQHCPVQSDGYDPSYTPDGQSLVYCVKEESGCSLRYFHLPTLSEEVLLRTDSFIASPQVSPDGDRIAFSGSLKESEDIWILNPDDGSLFQLTSDPAIDRDPVWDIPKARIVFTSDRNRGLACTTLFWIPIPEAFP